MRRKLAVSGWFEDTVSSLSLKDIENVLVCLAWELDSLQLARRFARNAVTAVEMMRCFTFLICFCD